MVFEKYFHSYIFFKDKTSEDIHLTVFLLNIILSFLFTKEKYILLQVNVESPTQYLHIPLDSMP